MEFVSLDPISKQLSLKRGPVPKPKGNEVLVRVAYSGICGTDLHILEGSFPAKSDGPLTLGHEFAGTVEALGDAVTTFKIGDQVAVDPNSGCNKCDPCHGGSYHFCEEGGINTTIGIFRNGGWATHTIVPDSQVYLVPEGVELHHAALTEPMSCLAHAWDKVNPVHVGEKVLVIGAGIIGLLFACLLHLHGLRKTVTVTSRQLRKRLAVEKLDLGYEANSPTEINNKTFDLAVDCSGSVSAMESAMPLLNHGGRLCVFGVADPNATLAINPFQIYTKELTIVGVKINPFTFPKALCLIHAMVDRYLDFERLGIRIYKLSEYNEALDALRKGEITKAVFKCS